MLEFEKIKPIYAVVAFPSHKIKAAYSDIRKAQQRNDTLLKYQGYKLIKFNPCEVIKND